MNKRLKELADQCTEFLEFKTESGHTRQQLRFDKEKFAELIVKECGQVLVDNTPVVDLVEDWDKGYDRAMNDCIHHIYEHFGVE